MEWVFCVEFRILLVSCFYVSCSRSVISVGEEKDNFSFTSLRTVIMWFLFGGVFFFISVLGMDSVILLWHSLCLSYNYYGEEKISNLKPSINYTSCKYLSIHH